MANPSAVEGQNSGAISCAGCKWKRIQLEFQTSSLEFSAGPYPARRVGGAVVMASWSFAGFGLLSLERCLKWSTLPCLWFSCPRNTLLVWSNPAHTLEMLLMPTQLMWAARQPWKSHRLAVPALYKILRCTCTPDFSYQRASLWLEMYRWRMSPAHRLFMISSRITGRTIPDRCWQHLVRISVLCGRLLATSCTLKYLQKNSRSWKNFLYNPLQIHPGILSL